MGFEHCSLCKNLFNKEKIDSIFSNGYKANHIGLKNVKDRIILLYGER